MKPNRDVDKKQKTLGIGKIYEGDSNAMNLKLVEFKLRKCLLHLL